MDAYLNTDNKSVQLLENVTKEFSIMLVETIRNEFLKTNLKDQKTIDRLSRKILKDLKIDSNEIKVPYFDILENLNLCIEVEMSGNQVSFLESQKFGETKFTDILERGMDTPEPIKRFAISEKHFISRLLPTIQKYTEDFEMTGDSIRIEFN